MKQQGGTLFCAWSVYLISACVSWSDVRTRENSPVVNDVTFTGVRGVTGQQNNSNDDVDIVLQLDQPVNLDKFVSPNSILSSQAIGQDNSSSDALENVRNTSVRESPSLYFGPNITEIVPESSSQTVVLLNGGTGGDVTLQPEESVTQSSSPYVSPNTNEVVPASSQTVVLQDDSEGTEDSRSHDSDDVTFSPDVSVTSDLVVPTDSTTLISLQPSHGSTENDSESGSEVRGVTESTPLYCNETTETLPYNATQHSEGRSQEDTANICDNNDGDVIIHEEKYSMLNDTHKITVIQHHTAVLITIRDIDEGDKFLIFQAHSQNHYLILSNQRTPDKDCYVNSTDPGLVLWTDHFTCSFGSSCQVYITNCHNSDITVLFMVQNYTSHDPIPGKYKAPCVAMPYLNMDPNILTTKVSYRAAAMASWDLDKVVGELRYEVYLTYMYERDLSEKKYWDTLISTSTLQGLKENGKSVDVRENNNTAEQLNVWLVSYSGVGAVITVVVSYNGSSGTLYSSGVSYGCNFIDAEEYSCTKLVTTLAKLFCASLLFIGGILLFLGHRWLNFTMFISGFLFSWCMLFLMFAQDTHSTINGLGWGTLVGAVLGGALWLLGWHMFQRPFHSSLLIIIMAVLFVGMMVTYFLRFAISPKTSNLSAFVVFPVIFAIVIIAYSIVDIKKVHIFSCTLLGSYAFIVPFAFYFGSSLTYIVINVLGLVTVQHYPDAVGYPPFQVCDIILLCLWVLLFGGGMAYQLYRERASPPFHPPNLTSWHNFKKSANFVFDKMFACLPMDPDPGGIDVEDRPAWMLRVVYTSKLAWRKLTCKRGDVPQSGYESFPRIRRLSQYNDPDSEVNESRMAIMLSRLREWKGRVRHYFRRGDERLLQDIEDEERQREEVEEQEEDESQLLEGTVSCCAFRNSQVVLDDAYTTSTEPQV